VTRGRDHEARGLGHVGERDGDRAPRRFPSLWPLATAPAIWAAHFLLTYVTAAIWHAKRPASEGSSSALQTTIAIYTALALAGIAVIGWRHARIASTATEGSPCTAGTDVGAYGGDVRADGAARRVFTGRVGVLLAGLSAVAVAFAQLAATLGGRP
jgi:hypothetical protein